MHSTYNERGGLMSFTLSVVGNTPSALFALSVGGNISTEFALNRDLQHSPEKVDLSGKEIEKRSYGHHLDYLLWRLI